MKPIKSKLKKSKVSEDAYKLPNLTPMTPLKVVASSTSKKNIASNQGNGSG